MATSSVIFQLCVVMKLFVCSNFLFPGRSCLQVYTNSTQWLYICMLEGCTASRWPCCRSKFCTVPGRWTHWLESNWEYSLQHYAAIVCLIIAIVRLSQSSSTYLHVLLLFVNIAHIYLHMQQDLHTIVFIKLYKVVYMNFLFSPPIVLQLVQRWVDM